MANSSGAGTGSGSRRRTRRGFRSTSAEGAAEIIGTMGRTNIYPLTVQFGDCDPAQMAYFPNFFRWFDAATHQFFKSAGFPDWRETEAKFGIIGTPVVATNCQFSLPTTYGDVLAVHTSVAAWRDKSFVLRHVLQRGDEVIAQSEETRVFARRHPTDPARLQAVPAPEELRRLCD